MADVGATPRWYRDHLGFDQLVFFPKAEPYVWASMRRDEIQVMLLRIEGYQKPDIAHLRPAGLWDAYISVRGVRELYEAVRQTTPIQMQLTQQPYGDWEFEVRDPNGYVLVFSELIEE